MRVIRVLIVEDEKPARHRLLQLLEKEETVEVVSVCETGEEALETLCQDGEIDLVFLDIHLSGMSGIEMIEKVGSERMPLVVFVTAYDQHALKAFELAAIDYLLKPFSDARFEEALFRARKALSQNNLHRSQNLHDLIENIRRLQAAPAAPRPKYLEQLAIEMRGQIRIIPVNQIDFISASGYYAELHVGDKRFFVREQIRMLAERLDPKCFCRIHRSTIVQLDRIDALDFQPGGRYSVLLQNGTRLRVSRSMRDELERHFAIK